MANIGDGLPKQGDGNQPLPDDPNNQPQKGENWFIKLLKWLFNVLVDKKLKMVVTTIIVLVLLTVLIVGGLLTWNHFNQYSNVNERSYSIKSFQLDSGTGVYEFITTTDKFVRVHKRFVECKTTMPDRGFGGNLTVVTFKDYKTVIYTPTEGGE